MISLTQSVPSLKDKIFERVSKMKTTLRFFAFALVAVMMLTVLASCSSFNAIKKNFEDAGYTLKEADDKTNKIVASLDEGEISVTAHRFVKEGEGLVGVLGLDYNALVLEFGSDADLQKAISENETVKGYIKDAQESQLVRGNCVLIPLSIEKLNEMLEVFNKGK